MWIMLWVFMGIGLRFPKVQKSIHPRKKQATRHLLSHGLSELFRDLHHHDYLDNFYPIRFCQ